MRPAPNAIQAGSPRTGARKLPRPGSEVPQPNPGGSATQARKFRTRRSGAPHSDAREPPKPDSEVPQSKPGGSAIQAR
eukprot:562055-Alexandrium_andersonii.AAC.1